MKTLLMVWIASWSLAQEPAPQKSVSPTRPPAPKAAIMDFEADVIEGRRKAPDLFLQTENQRFSPDALIYLRPNFNDFHAADKLRRPRLSK